mgnify:CR=1 FL=1
MTSIKEINQAILNRRIPHGAFKNAYERSKELFEIVELGLPGSGIMVYGSSGVGKTTLTKLVVEYGEKKYGADSVIRTQLSSGATVKGLLSDLLFAYGDPLFKSGSQKQLEARLANTIKERGTRIIIIDELQHLIPGGNISNRLADNILNTFKILDDTNVSFLLTGMEDIMLLWNLDEQIRSRFQTPYYLARPTYPKDKRTWKGIIQKYIETIEQHGMSIDCQDFADRCYAATQGAMRPLVLILTNAATFAFKDKQTVISTDHLRQAAEVQIDKNDGMPNAFDVDLERVQKFSRDHSTNLRLAPTTRGLGEIFAT